MNDYQKQFASVLYSCMQDEGLKSDFVDAMKAFVAENAIGAQAEFAVVQFNATTAFTGAVARAIDAATADPDTSAKLQAAIQQFTAANAARLKDAPAPSTVTLPGSSPVIWP